MFTILLFIPNFVSTDTELYGFVNKLTKWTIAFYVLKEGHINLGYSGKKWQKIQKSPNWIHFYYNCNNEIVIREIVIQGESINFKLPDVQLVAIKYNYNEFMKTNFISWESNPYINNNCYFLTLLNTIRKNKLSQQKCRKPVPMLIQLLSSISFYLNCIITWLNTDIFLIKLFQYSAIYTHIISWLNTIKLFIDNMFLGKDVNVKIIHLFVAYLVDICMGIIVIYCIKDWQYIMITSVFDSVQIIVTQVRDILEWLMGSPVGLKLNYAFNATMGTIYLKVNNRSQTQANLILLEVFLKPQSWWQTINRCLPKDEQKHLQFGNVVRSLLVGKLL